MTISTTHGEKLFEKTQHNIMRKILNKVQCFPIFILLPEYGLSKYAIFIHAFIYGIRNQKNKRAFLKNNIHENCMSIISSPPAPSFYPPPPMIPHHLSQMHGFFYTEVHV